MTPWHPCELCGFPIENGRKVHDICALDVQAMADKYIITREIAEFDLTASGGAIIPAGDEVWRVDEGHTTGELGGYPTRGIFRSLADVGAYLVEESKREAERLYILEHGLGRLFGDD